MILGVLTMSSSVISQATPRDKFKLGQPFWVLQTVHCNKLPGYAAYSTILIRRTYRKNVEKSPRCTPHNKHHLLSQQTSPSYRLYTNTLFSRFFGKEFGRLGGRLSDPDRVVSRPKSGTKNTLKLWRASQNAMVTPYWTDYVTGVNRPE